MIENNLILVFLIEILILITLYIFAMHSKFFLKVIVSITIVWYTAYTVLRIFTINFENIQTSIFSILLFLAELLAYFTFVMFIVLFYKTKNKKIPSNKEDINEDVDVLIATYNEDIKLVLFTALSAQNLKHSANVHVYVCDDNRREELKNLCQHFKINYISRNNNDHAKAGNYNNALLQTHSKYVVFLDADMVIKDNFLKETLFYFNEESTALVQTPQVFYNPDPFQFLDMSDFKNEQYLFMQHIEPQLDKYDSLIHVGTNAIFRRKALEEIGYIPTGSITEDMATGILLVEQGYKTYFLNKQLAFGLSAKTFEDYIVQHSRWAKGTFQLFSVYNPLRSKKLKKSQKIIFLSILSYWLTSFQKYIFILAPSLFLIFSLIIIKAPPWFFLLVQIPIIVLIMSMFRLISPNIRTILHSHIYDTVQMPFISKALLGQLFNKDTKFEVTPKDKTVDKPYYNFKIGIHFILLAIFIIISIGFGIYKLIYVEETLIYYFAIIVTLLWSIYNLIGVFAGIKIAYQKPVRRIHDRVSCNFTFKVNDNVVEATDISFSGIGFKSKHKFKINTNVTCEINGLSYDLLIIRNHEDSYGCTFSNLNQEQTRNLAHLYSEALHEYAKKG